MIPKKYRCAIYPTTALAALLTVPIFAPAQQNAIKCWEDETGAVGCGERVPPEHAQRGHREISRQGVTVKEIERAKTPEEILQEKRLIEKRVAEIAEKAKAIQRDKALLDSFDSVEDIETALEIQLTGIDAVENLVKRRVEKLYFALARNKQILSRENVTIEDTSAALKHIQSIQRQIEKNYKFIAVKKRERTALTEDYMWKAERFLQLTGGDARSSDSAAVDDNS